MSTITTKTETFITEHIPMMAAAEAETAESTYEEYLARIGEFTGDIDWQTVFEAADETNGGSAEKRKEVARIAAQTSILVNEPPLQPAFRRLHGNGGSFITVSGAGKILAAADIPSPEVPKHYGIPAPFILRKLGEAMLIEKLEKQGADWGKGYARLTQISERLKVTKPGSLPHIGMATLHEIEYSLETAGQDRNALAYTGASGRILAPLTRQHIVNYYPDLAKRMYGEQPHPDDLAGLLDTLSGTVANKVAVFGRSIFGHIVELPNPNHADNAGVDWN